ncbi:MAG TPA: hypothetical protein VGI84_03640 [Pseudonocardiaceae bacterium]|jgi:hypothetical protein
MILLLSPDIPASVHIANTVPMVPPPPPPKDPGGQGEDFGKSSPVGLVVLLLFFIAVALLVRSMNKHLRRVPKSFDEPKAPGGD